MDIGLGLIAAVSAAFIFFGWGLASKDKKVRTEARQFIILATIGFIALLIYGNNRP
jgi:hypothetical protein